MDNRQSIQILMRLRWRWVAVRVLACCMLGVGAGLLLAAILFHWHLPVSGSWAAGVLVFIAAFLWMRPWRIGLKDIARMLDEKHTALQESSSLLLRSPDGLNMLEHWQQERTGAALRTIGSPLPVQRFLLLPAAMLLAMLLLAAVMYRWPVDIGRLDGTGKKDPHQQQEALPFHLLSSAAIRIAPPGYTRKPTVTQSDLDLAAPEGSSLQWTLQTSQAAHSVEMIVNDSLHIAFQPSGNASEKWILNRQLNKSGFYQLRVDGHLSDLYKLEMIPDKAPRLQIHSPKQYTTIDFGDPELVRLLVSVSDDYGIADARINATTASGSGEAVKFKEQSISLHGFSPNGAEQQLQQTLALKTLGMQPGDELYFYVQATDNHGQQTRSDVYIVHLPDTAQLMSLEGMANSINLKPEYFRSQRQIIMDAEQLLKEKDSIATEAFKNRSNNLGIDQRLLRLRYGKFLGDEAESGETNVGDLGDAADFSNADKLRDAFTDKHDNAEDATFYSAETKKQLRATLSQMWESEMKLRTFSPREALPYAYKALRLLKDLQQQSRAYVAKTNFKTTPLDPAKRLKGDLTKIDQQLLQKNIEPQPDPELSIRASLAVLDTLRQWKQTPRNTDMAMLRDANLRLHEAAAKQPSLYLGCVESMKRILSSPHTAAAADIVQVQHGLQQLLSKAQRLPAAKQDNTGQALPKQYFRILQKKQS